MLQLDMESRVIEGVTVFADHARKDQFWYLPGPEPELATRGPDQVPQFTLISYRPAVADGGVKGGGFLTMEVMLKLDRRTERKILSRLAAEADGTPKLSPVPFDEGSVRIVALDLEGGGGTVGDAPPPGAFRAVETILGATRPSMAGDMNAVFSLGLGQEGAVILSQAFQQGGMPVGVIYDFTYTALRPALDVEIRANYKRIYDHLSMGIDLTAGAVIGGVPVYLDVGIDLAFEKLKQAGVIEIKVINFSTEEDKSNKEQWALDFFKNQLLADWFKPTLPPITPSTQNPGSGGGGGSSGGGSSGGGSSGGGSSGGGSSGGGSSGGGASGGGGGASGGGTSPGGGAAPGGGASPGGGGSAGGASPGGGAPPAGSGTPPAGGGGAPGGGEAPGGGSSPAGGGTPGGADAPAVTPAVRERTGLDRGPVVSDDLLETGLREAVLTKNIAHPQPGRDVTLTQRPNEAQVTLTFTGEGDPPVVEVDGTAVALESDRGLRFDLPAGTSRSFEARYRSITAPRETFRLKFDHAKPAAPGWQAQPPSASYLGYLQNRTNPLDTAFETTPGSGGTRGADALRAWLQGNSTPVTVDAHASFEGDPSKADLNQRLSERRLEVAQGIIAGTVPITAANPHGFSRAQQAGRQRDPNDRVVEVSRPGSNQPGTTIRGTVSRPAGGGDAPGGGAPGGGDAPGGGTPGRGDAPGGGTPGGGDAPGGGAPGGGDAPGGGTPGGGDAPGGGTPGGGDAPGGGAPGGGDAPGGGTPGGGDAPGGGAAPTVPGAGDMGIKLAFKLQKIEQVEDKTLVLHYNRQEAVQRKYAPQGLIGLLAGDLSGPPHFIDVDLDAPFFRRIEIEVDSPIDFGRIGLLTADVELEYGDRGKPADLKRKDMRFERGGATQHTHSFFMNADHDLGYRVRQQYHFDPLSGWEGSAFSYELPTETTLDRTLLLNPFNNFGFLELTVIPGDLDRGMIEETDVMLRYDGGHWTKDTTLTVRPDSPEQTWRLRLDDPERREFSYRLRHRMKDGSVHETEEIVQRATTVTVNDPFDDPLIIEFFPNYDPAGIQVLFVDVTYEDEAHGYRREERIEFRGDALQSQRLRIARFDPAKGEFSFRITKLAQDHSVARMASVRTEETIIFLGEHLTT